MTIDQIFEIASKQNASDVHIIVGEPPILRIEGELHQIKDAEAITKSVAQKIIYDILAPDQKERLEKDKELDLSYELKDGSRLRVNCYFEKGNVGLAARIIPSKIPTMEEIGMPEIVYQLTRQKQGLILLTGPTGCGKSTSLAAMIDLINQERSESIITLEDPIEFIYKPKKSVIIQRQLGQDMLSFGEGLKHALRQDPNILLVGEMRDLETVGTTITMAETGHLVFATLHTHNAGQTIDRIIDVFPPFQQEQVRLQLSLSLSAVISQHLIPAANGGRVALREILINNPAVANLIKENKVGQLKSVIQTSAEEGMITRDQYLKQLLNQKIITKEVYNAYLEDGEK
jgi:twitching motility protein PilT